jgi:hypothetical protein
MAVATALVLLIRAVAPGLDAFERAIIPLAVLTALVLALIARLGWWRAIGINAPSAWRATGLLILPAVKHMPEEVFTVLDSFVCAGGTVLVMPESLTRDEYNRPADYLKHWGICINAVEDQSIDSFGGMEQKYDQNMERSVRIGGGRKLKAVQFTGGVDAFDLVVSGIFQEVSADCGEIIASGPAAEPMLLNVSRGCGSIWYLAGMPERRSLAALLDMLFTRTGVQRPLKVTDSEGNRVQGLETRLVRRFHDDLIYLVNESGRDIEFKIETSRPFCKIRELRSLKYYNSPTGCIENGQVLLFSFQEDPVARFGAKASGESVKTQ